MPIPLSFLLLLFGVFLVAYFLFSFFLFFHLIRYGVSSSINIIVFGIYCFLTVSILFFTWSELYGVRWGDPIFSFVNTLPY